MKSYVIRRNEVKKKNEYNAYGGCMNSDNNG